MDCVYQPFIEQLKPEDWGVCEEEIVKEFTIHSDKFSKELQEAITLMNPDKEMFKLNADELQKQSSSDMSESAKLE